MWTSVRSESTATCNVQEYKVGPTVVMGSRSGWYEIKANICFMDPSRRSL